MLLTVSLAACGSSSAKSTSTTVAAQTGAATGAATGDSGGSSAQANIARAKAQIAAWERQPETLPVASPITTPIPAGKTVIAIGCGLSTCYLEDQLSQQAANYLHWNLQILNNNGSPQQIQNDWQQIIREKPFGVIDPGIPTTEFQSYLAQAKQLGIHVVTVGTTNPEGNGVDWVNFNGATGQSTEDFGAVWANWAVANSSDDAPQILYLDLPEYPILAGFLSSMKGTLSKIAPNATVYDLDIPINDVGASSGADLVVSYLRAHPGIKQVIATTDPLFIGLPAALKAASISGVNLFGEGPSSINAQYIKAGLQAGSIMEDAVEQFYGAIDALARISVGQQPVTWSDPIWVVTKENIPTFPTSGLTTVVVDGPAKFEALWK